MPVCDGAPARTARQVGFQPQPLSRALRCRDVAVERNRVPVAQFETVVAESPRPRVRAEIVKVRAAPVASFVLVIARDRPRSKPLAAPGRVIAVAELLLGPPEQRVVSEREDCAADPREQLRRLASGIERVTPGEIPGADEHLRHGRGRRRRRCWNWNSDVGRRGGSSRWTTAAASHVHERRAERGHDKQEARRAHGVRGQGSIRPRAHERLLPKQYAR